MSCSLNTVSKNRDISSNCSLIIKTRKLTSIPLPLLSCRLHFGSQIVSVTFRRGSPCHTLCLCGVSLLLRPSICCPHLFLCDIFQDHTQTVLSGCLTSFPLVCLTSFTVVCLTFPRIQSRLLERHEATCPVSCAGLTVGAWDVMMTSLLG